MFTCQRVPICLGVLSMFWALHFLPATSQGQEKPNPILEEVKAKVKNPGKPFTMVVWLQAKENMGQKFEAEFAPAIRATRMEKGCLAYDLNRDLENTNVYILYERWKTLADLEAHLQAKHITTLLPKLNNLMSRPPALKVMLPAEE